MAGLGTVGGHRSTHRPTVTSFATRVGSQALRRVTFGSTAAIVTSIGLLVGFASATVDRTAIVGSLLIVGIADNLSDSLSVHLYQESEGLEPADAFRSTVANFLARATVTATFVALALAVPMRWLWAAAAVWGGLLLSLLTTALAMRRGASVRREPGYHLGIAAAVIVLSRIIGVMISGHMP